MKTNKKHKSESNNNANYENSMKNKINVTTNASEKNNTSRIRTIMIEIIAMLVFVAIVLNYKTILAFATHNDSQKNEITTGSISAKVEEPHYTNNQIVVPNQEIAKNPTFTNNGVLKSYIRAQVYVPISNKVKYVNENEELITPNEEIELLTYHVNQGWEEVTGSTFSGIYEDAKGNRYKVRTYKYIQGGVEKVINPEETIDKTLFDTVKIINYADLDKAENLNIHVSALAIQSDGGTAEDLWTAFVNQNGTGIIGVK